MDGWPTDDRDTAEASANDKGRNSRTPLPNWTYPVVEHGSLSAVALHRKQQRFEWSFAVQESAKRKVVPMHPPVQVFPETLRRPFSHDMSVLQRADQGVQFLRTYYPDFEMSAELVRDEIAADERASQAIKEFNPYFGSMLETLTCTRKAGRSLTCLAFPMGVSYLDLNVSPLMYSRKRNLRLDATTKPIRSFQTPIQQLKASIPQSTEDEEHVLATLLGVRTMGSTTLLDIHSTNTLASTLEVEELVDITRYDVGNRPIVDMILPATERTLAILVNDAGAMYRCAAPSGAKSLQRLHNPADNSSDFKNEMFWKLATWDGEDSCLAMSRQNVYCVDFRTQDDVLDLYNSKQSGALLTSIETPQKDRLIRLVTTKELLWLDIRSPNKPLFGVKHYRDPDRTLQSHTRIIAKAPISFLTSRRNGLVSVYDVSRSGPSIRMASAAYCLPPLRKPDGPNFGHVFVQHPHSSNNEKISALQVSDLGAVNMLHLKLADDTEGPMEGGPANRNWSGEVEELDEQVKGSSIDVGPLGARTFSEANLQPAYQRLFMDFTKHDQLDAVYDLLEKMPMFWQEVDVPIEHAVTLFDVAYHCGPEPSNSSRNDFFTESTLNSKRGYRAMMQGRIPVQQIARRAPWHLNITPFIKLQVSDIHEDPKETLKHLSRYNLAADGRRPAGSLRREAEAREQLTLDLHLSSDVFSPSRFCKPAGLDIDAAMDTMSRATEALSLSEMEPSDVQFGFLHPVRKDTIDYYAGTTDTQKDTNKHLVPLGARILMKEWDVGVDPSTYRYDDAYDVSHAGKPVLRYTRNALPRPMPQNREQATQLQRPPLVVPANNAAPPTITNSQTFGEGTPFPASQAPPTRPNDRRPITQTGNQPLDSWDTQPSSQVPFASTQVVPGPYGGRPGPLKKKPAKKRVGGF